MMFFIQIILEFKFLSIPIQIGTKRFYFFLITRFLWNIWTRSIAICNTVYNYEKIKFQ